MIENVNVEIDENNLDRECINLPSQYLRAATAAAECRRAVAEAERSLDLVESDLSKEIRSNPSGFGLEKITEAALKATVIAQPAYQKVERRVAQARYESDLAQALVWAMENKKKSLSMLVELHGLGYFSDVKVSKAGKEVVEQMTQRRVRRREDD